MRTHRSWLEYYPIMIAIGSGGFLGKGLLNGTQSSLRFLPVNHTDFCLFGCGGRAGFVRAMVVLSLYVFLIWRGLRIAAKARIPMARSWLPVPRYLLFPLSDQRRYDVGDYACNRPPLPSSPLGQYHANQSAGIGIILNVGLRRIKIMF